MFRQRHDLTLTRWRRSLPPRPSRRALRADLLVIAPSSHRCHASAASDSAAEEDMTNNMSLVKPDDIPEADFANYFCTYGACRRRSLVLDPCLSDMTAI
jgi:hypothetical protein